MNFNKGKIYSVLLITAFVLSTFSQHCFAKNTSDEEKKQFIEVKSIDTGNIKTLENKFNELHSNIVIFLNLNKSTLEFNNQVEKIILLCDNIFTESSLLAKRINNFLKEEHYQHYLLDNTKNLDEFETNIISWLK